jgi:hypothetical protein
MNRLRILLACIPAPGTRFLEDWKNSLATDCDVVHDHHEFLHGDGPFDVVHFHWPEYISFEVEAALLGELPDTLIAGVLDRIKFWKTRGSRVVVHRHNVLPHVYADSGFERLYERVYSLSDAVIHLGEYSRTEFHQRYAGCFDVTQQVHVVIPHANFNSYENTISKAEARRQLGLRQSSKVVLVFGGIGHPEEQDTVLNGFRGLKTLNKTLVAPNWKDRLLNTKNIRLKYFVRDMQRLFYRFHPQYKFGHAFVPDEQVQCYLNASDVLLIQRRNPLNSSNLVLGFTFGRVVVGPNQGNVGEILRATGNPVFEPGCAKSFSDALDRGLTLSQQGHGEMNRRHADREWDLMKTGQQYIARYRLLKKMVAQ